MKFKVRSSPLEDVVVVGAVVRGVGIVDVVAVTGVFVVVVAL